MGRIRRWLSYSRWVVQSVLAAVTTVPMLNTLVIHEQWSIRKRKKKLSCSSSSLSLCHSHGVVLVCMLVLLVIVGIVMVIMVLVVLACC